jgi:hypothetical protein
VVRDWRSENHAVRSVSEFGTPKKRNASGKQLVRWFHDISRNGRDHGARQCASSIGHNGISFRLTSPSAGRPPQNVFASVYTTNIQEDMAPREFQER